MCESMSLQGWTVEINPVDILCNWKRLPMSKKAAFIFVQKQPPFCSIYVSFLNSYAHKNKKSQFGLFSFLLLGVITVNKADNVQGESDFLSDRKYLILMTKKQRNIRVEGKLFHPSSFCATDHLKLSFSEFSSLLCGSRSASSIHNIHHISNMDVSFLILEFFLHPQKSHLHPGEDNVRGVQRLTLPRRSQGSAIIILLNHLSALCHLMHFLITY